MSTIARPATPNQPAIPNARIRALIIDDDAWSQRLLRGMLKECFPMLHVETITTPSASPGYNIYLVDNEFSGAHHANRLARELRSAEPDALIIAFSGALDQRTLLDLLNAGSDGACDKSSLSDLPKVMTIIQRYIETLITSQNNRRRGSIRESMRAVCELIKEWNQRLDIEEARHAAQR